MQRPILTTIAILCLGVSVAACTSTRFDEPRTRGPRAQASLEAVPAFPSGTVSAAPLAPPPGVRASPDAAPPPGPQAALPRPEPAVIPEPVAPPAPPPPVTTSGRASVVGTWDAKDATGASCKVTLSSAPALDLYRASAANCPNRDLAKVTAWDFRDGEVYLYQQGGSVAARLRQGGGALDGALTKSGASLALVR